MIFAIFFQTRIPHSFWVWQVSLPPGHYGVGVSVAVDVSVGVAVSVGSVVAVSVAVCFGLYPAGVGR